MATTYKTTAASWHLGWTVSPTRLDDGIIDASAGSGPFSPGNTLSLGSLWMQSSAASAISATSGSYATVLYNRGSSPSNYTISLADNKTLSVQTQIVFDGSVNGSADQSVYVGTGGQLNANTSVNGTVNVSKYGPGTWRLAATENGSVSSASGPSSLTIFAGDILTGSGAAGNALGTGNVTFSGGRLVVSVSRTFANALILSGNGTLRSEGTAIATMNAGASGAGTLTIERSGSGSITFGSSLTLSCPVSVSSGGLLTLGSATNLTGSTLSGGGTIAMGGGVISSNAPNFTGSVTGDWYYNANGTFAGRVTGTANSSGGTTYFTNASSTGGFNYIYYAYVHLSGSMTGTSGLDGYTWVRAGSVSTPGRLYLDGASVRYNKNLALMDNGSLLLTGGAKIGQDATNVPILVTNTDNYAAGLRGQVICDDISTCVVGGFTGYYIGSSSSSTGTVHLVAKTGGTLEFAGTLNAGTAGNAMTVRINGSDISDFSAYAGTVKLSGTMLGTTNPMRLVKGTLHISRPVTTGLGAGLTVEGGARVAFSSTGAFAAQLSGPVTMQANAIMQFGAP